MRTKLYSNILIIVTCLSGTGILYGIAKPSPKKNILICPNHSLNLQRESIIQEYRKTLFIKGTNGVTLMHPVYIYDGEPVAQLIPSPGRDNAIHPIEKSGTTSHVVNCTLEENK